MTHHLWQVVEALVGLLVCLFVLGVVLQPIVLVGQLLLKFPIASTVIISIICFIELIGFIFGGIGPAELAEPVPKLLICLSFLAAAVVYYFLSENMPFLRMFVGLGKIVAALVSDWLQLNKYSSDPHGPHGFDRLAFIVGGMFVISSGFKDFSKAMDEKASQIDAEKAVLLQPSVDATTVSPTGTPPQTSSPPKMDPKYARENVRL